MRASKYYAPTLRQAPVEAELTSHKLLLRGGFVRPLTAGVFSWLPLGLRVMRKISDIVREEMDRAGAIEVHLPVLAPRELWEQSGRWDTFQPTPFRVQDRTERWFCLGPTHEEVITDLVAADLHSYRDLPLTLYQIQVKFRDEMRPRGGLLRVKEFFMKDAYSFDATPEGLDRIYNLVRSPAIGINFDTGNAYLAGQDPYSWLEHVVDRLVHVHAKDISVEHAEAERGKVTGTPVGCACGDGVLDWKRICDICRRAPRDIVLSVECGSIEQAERSFHHLKQFV